MVICWVLPYRVFSSLTHKYTAMLAQMANQILKVQQLAAEAIAAD